jgi:parallel beta-helix repeat protein
MKIVIKDSGGVVKQGYNCSNNIGNGIMLINAWECDISGNTCVDNTKSGILLKKKSRDNKISGNTVDRNGENDPNHFDIKLSNDGGGNIFPGNKSDTGQVNNYTRSPDNLPGM